MEELKERKLKVYDQARGGYYNIPTILLKGHWLEQLGFNIHDEIIVTCNEGELIIKKINKD